MKKMIKRFELICLILMLAFSMAACGEKEEERETVKTSKEEKSNKKDKDDEEDEDEKKSSKEDKESLDESEEEATPEPLDEKKEYDKEVLQILGEAWSILNNFFESENLDSLEEARIKLEEINLRKCTKETQRLVEENELIINDLALIYEWGQSLIQFGTDFEQIDFGNYDLTDISTLEEVENVYNTVTYAIEECEEIETPQFMEHAVKREIELLERYQTLLVELYKAGQSGDVLKGMSAYSFGNDYKTEQDDLFNDINKIIKELESHTGIYMDRVDMLSDEFVHNMKAISEGDYDGVDFSYLEELENTKVTTSISCIDTIYPAMYNRLQAVAIVNLSYVNGEKDVLVTVEVDGFSQKYEKTIKVNQLPQRFYIKPPVLSSGLNLDSQKNTQIKVTVTDLDTGNIIATETENVKIMSINDFILSNNEYGYTNFADVLAWVTPESDYIQELLRIAADNMEKYTGYHGIPGYQYVIDEDDTTITAYQVYAIQKAINDVGVRYVMSSYSIGEASKATQRVNRPDETLLSKSGICIETSVLMASALQAAGLNPMIVLTTGHCQVAVETWEGSGQYLLIETTLLPIGDPYDSYGNSYYISSLLQTGTGEEWAQYLDQNNGMVYNCDWATIMGITPLIYE